MLRSQWIIPTLGMLIAFVGRANAQEPISATETLKSVTAGKELLDRGDKLADKGETTEAVLRYKEAFEKLLPVMRGIPFKHEVKRDVTERVKLRDVLLKELDTEVTPEEMRGSEKAYKAFGLIPETMDLKETLVQLYTEEIAAFYDPKTKTMHLIEEPKAPKKPVGLLERLLGKSDGFDKDENKTVIAHELTHALADQNYDLDAMQDAVKDDDDRMTALSSLIEGEATLTMMGAQSEDYEGKSTSKLPAEALDRTFSLLGPMMTMGSGPTLRKAPPILAESMIFPYLKGMVFCAKLTNDGDWKAIDKAYADPPRSTEQILHPEKYSTKPDQPMAIDLGKLAIPEGWKTIYRNVMGELQIGVMLAKHLGKKAAAGWDGDTYLVCEGPDDRTGLVWMTTWDSEDDAREFAESFVAYQTTRMGKDIPSPAEVSNALRRTEGGKVYAVERRGVDVAVVEGFPAEKTEALIEMVFKAEKTEKPILKPVKDKKKNE